jgi:hypothetical protein
MRYRSAAVRPESSPRIAAPHTTTDGRILEAAFVLLFAGFCTPSHGLA